VVTFAALAVDPRARLLFIDGQAPIGLGADQARVLQLLIEGGGDFVAVSQMELDTVNAVATTVVSLNSVLRNAGGLAVIVEEAGRGYRLIDSAAEMSLRFGDLRLSSVTRLLLISGRQPLILSPQNAAVLELLMLARGGPVAAREVQAVSARTAPGAAVGNLSRRMKGSGTRVTIVNDRSCGWRLVASE
jgi:DNA-binding response OmpR family regulator